MIKYTLINSIPDVVFDGKANVAKVMSVIKEKKIDAKIYFHPDVAVKSLELHLSVYGGSPMEVLKCLCLMGKQGPLVVVASGEVLLDNKRIAEVSGYNKISMAKINDLRKYFSRGPGEVDPLTIPSGIPVFIEEKLLEKEWVVGSCGSPHVGLGLRPIDIVANIDSSVVPLSK